MNLETVIAAFFADGRTQTLLLLIVVDLVTGVLAAIQKGTYDWQSVGNFFRTNVMPYVGGYLLVYAIGAYAQLSGLPVPQVVLDALSQVTQWGGAAVAIANLLASILANVQALQPDPATAAAKARAQDQARLTQLQAQYQATQRRLAAAQPAQQAAPVPAIYPYTGAPVPAASADAGPPPEDAPAPVLPPNDPPSPS